MITLNEFNSSITPNSTADNAIRNATQSISNVTKQLPTVGIIIGVLLIVAAVIGIAYYVGQKQMYQ